MRPPPICDHLVAHVLRVAEWGGTAGPDIGADIAALAAIAHRVVRAGSSSAERHGNKGAEPAPEGVAGAAAL